MKQYNKCPPAVRAGIIRTTALIMLFCLPFLAMAQGPDPGPCPTCIPIDGGLSLLIAAGVGYGIKKVRDSRKKQKRNMEAN